MKKFVTFVLFIGLAVAVLPSKSSAQCPSDIEGDPKCPDEKLYEDQAKIRIEKFKKEINMLEQTLSNLEAQIAEMEKKLNGTKAKLKDCNESVYEMLGATPNDIEAFRQKLGVIAGKVRSMQRLSDDVLADRQDEVYALEDELNELRMSKIALLPEFYNKIVKLAKDINPGLIREKKVEEYIVKSWFENRDCLWNISGNVDIYGDPLQWPKIWQANTDKIRNPDLIYPGQVLTVPPQGPKTPEEVRAERRYWRQKSQEMEEKKEEQSKGEGAE